MQPAVRVVRRPVDILKSNVKWVSAFGGITVAAIGGIATFFCYSKGQQPLEEQNRSFRSRITVESKSLSCCLSSYPSPQVLGSFTSRFGISVTQFVNAALHLCPVEFHLHCAEEFIRRIELPIRQIIEKELTKATFPISTLPENTPLVGVGEVPVDVKIIAVVQLYLDKVVDEGYMKFFKKIEVQAAIEEAVKSWQEDTKAAKQKSPTKPQDFDQEVNIRVTQVLQGMRDAIEIYLVANWEEALYFDPATYMDGAFGHQHSAEAMGMNVGTRGACHLYSDKSSAFFDQFLGMDELNRYSATVAQNSRKSSSPTAEVEDDATLRGLDMELVEDALSKLKKYGVVLVKNALTKEQVKKLKANLHAAKPQAAQIAEALIADDGNTYCWRPTRGRLHCLLRTTRAESKLLDLQRVWMPLVYGYLPTEQFSASAVETFKKKNFRVTNWNTPQDAPSDGDIQHPSKRLFLSDIQTVISDPLAVPQHWHMDNSKPSLTVIVPLVPITEDNGPTQLLPGSHHLHPEHKASLKEKFSNWKSFYEAFQHSEGPYGSSLDVGDVYIYDSRVIHRGMQNETWNPRTVVVFRYDYENYPPPGQGFLAPRLVNSIGDVSNLLSKLYKMV